MSTSLRDLLPDEIAMSETTTPGAVDALLLSEREAIRGSVEKRQAEFATGRHCARTALAALGWPGAFRSTIGVGEHRQPLWPAGIVGSITHSEGFYAAAAARTRDLVALGIDVEVNAALPDDVIRETCHESELVGLPAIDGVSWPTVLFSAREAVFKAWYPRAGSWLGFHDVTIGVDVGTGRFGVHFLEPCREQAVEAAMIGLEGAVGWSATHVHAGAWLRPAVGVQL